ncbi:Ig-like domain-containing protein [Cytophagaceae bacterium ABcell3]|nr:Ig-like domain-containing protein [Cytophagaceae bacterium ABcell3]
MPSLLSGQSTTTFNSVNDDPVPSFTSPAYATNVEGWDISVYDKGGLGVNLRLMGADEQYLASFSQFGEWISYISFKNTNGLSFKLYQFQIRYNTEEGDPESEITVIGYKNNEPVPGATYTLTGTNTFTNSEEWWTLDVSGINQFEDIDEFRFSATGTPNEIWRLDINNVVFEEAPPASLPTVTTSSPTSITTTSATLGGNVTDDGGATVTERGIVYSTSTYPTTSDNKVPIGEGTGSFSQSVTGLNPGTLYYTRAYAINSEGTTYGTQQSFTTLSSVTSIKRYEPTAAITNREEIVFEVNLSGPVRGLSTSNFNLTASGITGHEITNVSGSEESYLVEVNTGTGDGTLRLNLSNSTGVAPSISGLPYTSGQIISIDKTPPTVTISSDVNRPTNESPFSVKIEFSKNVVGFQQEDIIVEGGSTSNFVNNSGYFTLDITPDEDSEITVDVPAGVARDAAGNENEAAEQFSIIYDGTAPTVAISSELSSPTNTSPITVDFDFSKEVTGFSIDDIIISGGTAGNFTGNGSSYSVEINPDGDGEITVDLPAGVARDAAGNENTEAEQFSIIYDGTAPTVTISSELSNPTNASPITVDFNFSKEVTGFSIDDIIISGGTPNRFSGDGSSYSVEINPDGDGEITVDVPAGVARDAAGNENTEAEQFSIIYDGTEPTVTISSELGSPTNASPITVDFDFSKEVTGFSIDDIIISGGTPNRFSGDGSSYSVEINPDGDGEITVDVPAGVARDAAGNENEAAEQFSIIYDGTAPTVTISSELSSPTNTSPITVDFDFSKEVTGFSIDDIIVSGGTADNFTGEGSSYSVEINPDGDGEITVDVPAGVARDAAGNENEAAEQFSIIYDGTAPTVSISSELSSPTNTSPITVDFDFSKEVTGFSIDDIIVSGGTPNRFSGEGSSYSVEINPDDDGEITVDVPAGVARDHAGNENTEAEQFSIIYDGTAPTVSISSELSSPTNTSPITVDFDFSKEVTGFSIDDIIVSGGTSDNFTGNGSSYSVEINPDADGEITVDVPAGVARDHAGNENTEAEQFSIIYDGTAPTVTISSELSSPTNTSPITVDFDFSKEVTGFSIDDIIVSGGTSDNFTGNGSSYSVEINPDGDGEITVDVPAGVARDAAGNENEAAEPFSIIYDGTAPTVTISSELSSPTNASPITVDFDFSKEVTGFSIDDIIVSGGTPNRFSGEGSSYSVEINPDDDGEITVDVPAGVARDHAGNENTEAEQFSIIYDRTAPTVTISSELDSPTNASPIIINFDFSKEVTGFNIDDIIVSGGTPNRFSGEGSSYSVEINPDDDGEITVDVPAGVARDHAGNENTEAEQFSIIYDRTAPTVTISSELDSPTNASPIIINFDFSKEVTGFNIGDIIVSGGTPNRFSGDGSSYSVEINPDTDGEITVDVPAGVARDHAGNENTEAEQFSIIYDGTAPTVSISSELSSPANTSPITVNFDFSKEVTGFSIDDIIVSGGTPNRFSGDGSSYSVEINPDGDGEITVDVPAGVARDEAGNENEAAEQFSIIYDGTAPTVSISSELSSPTNTSPITVNFDFSKEVTGFSIDDIIVSGGTPNRFSGDGSSYSVEINPDGDGEITVDVPAGVARDEAGNENEAAEQFSIIYDGTAPTVSISSELSSPTNTSPITVNFDFSKEVTGFSIDDIIVSGGTPNRFSGDGSSYSVEINPDEDGEITVDVPAGVARDEAGNENEAAEQFSIIYDGTAPTVSISSELSSPANTSPITVNFDFSKEVTGFSIDDIIVSGGTPNRFSGDGSSYSVEINPDGDGEITVDVPAGVARDEAGNENEAAEQFSIIYDGTAPTVSISSELSSPTNTSPITVDFDFSKEVTGFSIDDIIVSGGTPNRFSGEGSSYSVEINPDDDGEITVDVPAGVARDAAGNENEAAEQFSIIYDGTAPTVSISSELSSPTNTSPITVDFDFSKEVTGFSIDDIIVSGGTADNFTGNGSSYSVEINPDGDGEITVDVPAGVARDHAGNENTEAEQFSIIYDGTAPTVSISSELSSPTNTSPITVYFDFSKEVTGFSIDDMIVSGGTPNRFSGEGSSYSVEINPDGEGEVTVDVPAGVARDAAGNENEAAETWTIEYYTSPTCEELVILNEPEDITACPEEQVTLTSTVEGTTLSYQWQVDEGDGFTNLANNDEYTGTESYRLTINVHQSHEGNKYRLLVIDSCETSKYSAAALLSFPEDDSCDDVTAIDQMSKAQFDLFPNPATDHINISINADYTLKAAIEVYNLHGQKLMNQESNISDYVKLDVSQLPTGTYLVVIKTEEGQTAIKWLKH